ncbi:MAG TPA: ATP-dependent DNA helicase [Dongiaceae bacterium]|nr:ATP-dependent DNA helicase [Dongiaceae bacterium]
MTFDSRYKALNAAQKQAVDTIDGPVMVVAGPGTGKTELLSVRIANILQKTDTLPENILCLTFTESGQAAMRERLVGIIGKDAYKVAIHTFHSFGSDVMSHNREYFYNNAQFEPADELKQYEVLRSIFEELDHGNVLTSTMNGEFTYLNDTSRIISELKRNSALTDAELRAVIDQNEAALDFAEPLLQPILAERVSKTTAAKLAKVLETLEQQAAQVEPLYEVTPLVKVITESLRAMLDETETVHPTKPISAWKSQWLERNEHKELVLKDRKRLVKLRALASIYFEYLARMQAQSLYDFDDMIMQAVHAIETQPDLRFNLQEQYLYIMVDEFQDTNLAQLRILHALTDNPVNEGAPNILVVGDDDQAIYGFQGADVSNILSFSDTYPTRKLVVLTENYRSEAAILAASRTVIAQGTDRLELRIPELDKQLTAQRTGQGSVSLWHTPTINDERQAIVDGIAQTIKKGTAPSSIAVLARRHADIQSLLPYFGAADIAVRYEREESVLDSPPIQALEQLAKVIVALSEGNHQVVEAALPELLSHPAWGIAPEALWKLSLTAHREHQFWMEVMATTPEFAPIHAWLIARAQEVATTPLEPMVDALIGMNEDETQLSPFFTYYFSPEVLQDNPSAYLECLNALRTIRTKLREYRPGVTLSLKELLHFIDLHRRLDIGIAATRYSLASDVPAVQLLTAHKSKGLEFDTVYVFNGVDSIWGHSARTVSRSISYPENLPLAPAGNSADERLRLFYVAMTRARNELIITYSDTNDADKQTLKADFLVAVEAPVVEQAEQTIAQETYTAQLAWYQPHTEPTLAMKELLAPQLEHFKLSATSLNAFLDVTRGGPQAFLLNNLLHFPSAKHPAAAYGTAVHDTMQQAHTHLLATGELKPLEDTLHDFEVNLTKQRLSEHDFQHYLQQGSDHLTTFLTSGAAVVTPTQKAEVGFGGQDVRLGEARLTGSLDVININEDDRTIWVTDYKTGKPALAWDKGSDATKIKLHKYRQQLLFYKLLAEASSLYSRYQVTKGHLAFIEPTPAGESIVLPLELDGSDDTRTRQLIEAVWKHIIALELPDTSAYSSDLKGILAFEQDLIDGIV